MPDLAEVAREFDIMVATLRRSEALIRQAAEENAHALKAPLAVIAQAIEPLRRDLPAGSTGLRRSVELISLSVDRLDALVSTGRRIDETLASLVDCPRHRIDLSALLSTLGQGFASFAEERGLHFGLHIAPGLVVVGGAEQIEPRYKNLSERLEALKERHDRGLLNSVEFLKTLLELARELVATEKETPPQEDEDRGKAVLTELFQQVRTEAPPVVVERIVADIDEIVRLVRASQVGNKPPPVNARCGRS